MSDAPKLLLGIGATKAGTSWVYRYLAEHPEVHTRSIKELHYFDVLRWNGTGPDLYAEHGTRMARLMGRVDSDKPQLARQIKDHQDWLAAFDGKTPNDEGYLSYLAGGAVNERLMVDFTPSYSIMDGAGWRHMVQVGDDAKVLYLLRDPVSRLWSHARMSAGRHFQSLKEKPTEEAIYDQAHKVVAQVLDGKRELISARSNYRRGLNRLYRFVPAERRLVLFFEELFQQDTLDRLCDFCGISRHEGAVDTKVHESPKAAMDPELATRAAAWLLPQYRVVENRIGPLPEAWQRAREAA